MKTVRCLRGCLITALFLILISDGVLGQNLVSLYYDDGEADDGLWMDDLRGHSVLYTAPCDDWTLASIAIYGKRTLDPKSDVFVIEVWDENLTLLSRTTDRPASFFSGEFGWALVDIPDVKVSRNFFVNFYEFAGVYVGIDLGNASGRSLITARNPNSILEWSITPQQQNQTNWMIRAFGYSPDPQISINVSSDVASGENPATIELRAEDPDGNLKNAVLYIMSNESQEVVWSEVKPLEGFEAETNFSWSGKVRQISNSSFSVSPVLATNNVEFSENVSSYLAYSVPCDLQLEPGTSSISAIAYFGNDGKLNALIDVLGRGHYFSKDVLTVIAPDIDYMDYMGNNITLSEGDSSIVFYKMAFGPEGQFLKPHPPMALSKSALFNYGLMLDIVEADSGEYLAVVVVDDWAYNSIGALGDRMIMN